MFECVHRDAFLDVQTTFLEHRERETLFVNSSFQWNLADLVLRGGVRTRILHTFFKISTFPKMF